MSIINEAQQQLSAESMLAAAFPQGFLWGAATASYQIEGAVHEDGRSPSIWDTFAAIPGKVYQGQNGDVAADHYHLMNNDVAMMAQLGLGAYRFSIAWPRILPTGRVPLEPRGLDFYERLVDALLANNIQPYATLYHWDLPQALQDQGGWTNRDTAYAFADYAETVVKRLGNRVAGWITLNEPWCAAYLGYGIGIHAPGIQDRQTAITVGHHVLLAHGLALPRIRAHMKRDAQVGITLNFTPVYAIDERPETQHDVELVDAFTNRWFLDPIFRGRYPEQMFTSMGLQPPPMQDGDMQVISAPVDFLGVNNYTRTVIRGRDRTQVSSLLADTPDVVERIPGATYTEMGWEVHPQSLRDLLIRLYRDYAVPALYVTENGAAFNDVWSGSDLVQDPQRIDYLRTYLAGLGEAIAQGVPLKGYFVWSLLDNFEWAEGYSKRFGIVYIDYSSQRRIWKESAYWYANLIRNHQQAHLTPS